MLSRAHVLRALDTKREAFLSFEGEQRDMRDRYTAYLQALATESQASLEQKLRSIPRPGARPTQERIAGQSIIRPFEASWQNHEQARRWAMERLRGAHTIAVDGSQITPDPSVLIPVGAVQVGWFDNPHDATQPYVKDIHFEVLAPDELSPDRLERQTYPDQLVNARRFDLECQQVAATLRSYAGAQPTPIVFFDGSLAISFAAQMRPELRQRYIDGVLAMLDASEKARVPLVAYVDTSYATDLVAMLTCLHTEVGPSRLSDGALLRPLMGWGDRTEAFVCARDDALFEDDPSRDYYDRVHFVYLRVSTSHPPVRLDLPSWILDDDRLDEVIDLVRAECIVGTGYPYAIETADALAVITAQDRERFYAVLQQFLQDNGLNWTVSRKTLSKHGRR